MLGAYLQFANACSFAHWMSLLACSDHCYNEGDADEKRADAYMQAYERVIANTPWMPILGNHEFYVKLAPLLAPLARIHVASIAQEL